VIRLQRVRTAGAIPLGFRGQKRVERALLLLVGTRDGTLEFTSKNSYWKGAKPQLKRESAGKCAYCEAPTDVVAHGDVEHFRPKSRYWWLAYCYDNYLFSCQICNQTFKGDEFPRVGPELALDPPLPNPFPNNLTDVQLREMAARFAPDPFNDGEGFPMARFVAAVEAEQAGLLDPYTFDPETIFAWEADPVLKEVRAAPRDQVSATTRVFADMVRLLGLNREELLRERWNRFSILDRVRIALEDDGLSTPARDSLVSVVRDMTRPDAPYAGMVRYFVRVAWQLDVD
jgi:hypothetical protein